MALPAVFFPGLPRAANLDAVVTESNGAPVGDAVVYALPTNGKLPPRLPATAQIDQVHKSFVPLVSVVRTGTAISFPNKDSVRHHVYSFSQAKTFEIKLYSGEMAAPVVFDKPGPVVLGCNIHDAMVGYVLIVDTPYFAKTDNAGRARIEGLPAGEYAMHTWHFRAATSDAEVVQSVNLATDVEMHATVELKPQ